MLLPAFFGKKVVLLQKHHQKTTTHEKQPTKKQKNQMHIAIAGNIGSGKTTLTNLLVKHYGWKPQFEAVDFNPYLDDYYKDIARWSFNLEVYFLKQPHILVAILQV